MRRRTGNLEEPIGLRAGDHVCWTYASDYEHRRMLTTYFGDGVALGDKLAYFAPRGEQDRLLGYLDDAEIDSAALVASGQLTIGSAESAYMPDGRFDPDDRLAAYRSMVDATVSEGYPSLRVCGEAGWITKDPSNHGPWAAYEMRADVLASQLSFVALCAYDLRESDRDAIRIVDALHALGLNAKGPRSIFNVHAEADGGLAIEGEVDLSCAEPLKAVLLEAVRDVAAPYIDVSELTFADVDGVRAILAAAAAVSERHGTFELRGASPSFRRVWGLVTSRASLN